MRPSSGNFGFMNILMTADYNFSRLSDKCQNTLKVRTVIRHTWSDIVFLCIDIQYKKSYWYTIASLPGPCQASQTAHVKVSMNDGSCTIRCTRRSPLVISFKSGTNSTRQSVNKRWILHHPSYSRDKTVTDTPFHIQFATA